MQNIIDIWQRLDLRRRVALVGATALVFAAVLLLARQMQQSDQAMLYAGLDPRAAGEIIATLDQRGQTYAVRGDSIYVAAEARDALRLALAGEGLPNSGSAGYELLDTLSGFGTTAQMFDAAYWRAKEGELARTLRSIPGMRMVRVHLALGFSDPFRRDIGPSASAALTSNQPITAEQARAVKHLIASAVQGLKPDQVEVIDTQTGLVLGQADDTSGAGTTQESRAEMIRLRVERLLAARVGPGNAVVEVALELVTEREQVTERRFDPDSRVAISQDTEEKQQKGREPSGAVTVASNLPDGPQNQTGEAQRESTETRERINFEVSETQRDLLRSPGGIKRLSLAVLVNGVMAPDASGQMQWQPRSDTELSALQDLVAAAVGLDPARGDTITLKSLEFAALPSATLVDTAGWAAPLASLDLAQTLQILALAAVAIVLMLFVLRPLLRAPSNTFAASVPLALPDIPAALALPATSGMADSAFNLPDLPMVDFATSDADVETPADRLRRMIEMRKPESIEILRGWLDPEPEEA